MKLINYTIIILAISLLAYPAMLNAQGIIQLKNQSTDRCLNIHGGQHDFEGGPITSYSCADSKDQKWKLIWLSNGNVKLKNKRTGRCLNIHGSQHDFEGAPATSYSCADTPDQEWELIRLSANIVKLKNVSTDRCLNIHRGKDDFEGGRVTSYSCADTPDQEWALLDLSGARIVMRDRGKGLTATDKTAINDAFTNAMRMANRVAAEIEAVWDQPGRVRKRRERRRDAWSAHTNFTKWFGTSRRHILIRRVRRRIKRLRKWLKKGRIIAIAHSNGDFACRNNKDARSRFPRRPLKVHLCPSWFALSPNSRAAVVIHELVHELGFTHPKDTTIRAEALSLARKSSRRARRSPENFEHLYALFFF